MHLIHKTKQKHSGQGGNNQGTFYRSELMLNSPSFLPGETKKGGEEEEERDLVDQNEIPLGKLTNYGHLYS